MMGTHTTIYRTKSSIPFHCRFLASHGRSAYRAFRSVFSIHTGHVSFLPTIVQPLIQSSWKRRLHGSWIVGSKGFSPPRWELSWRSLLQSAQMWGFTDSFRPNDIVAACKHAHASLQMLYEPHGQMLRLGQVLASRSTAAVTVMHAAKRHIDTGRAQIVKHWTCETLVICSILGKTVQLQLKTWTLGLSSM